MLTISCKDLDTECDFIGKANSEDELMMQLVYHIVKVHRPNIGEIIKSELRETVRARTKKN